MGELSDKLKQEANKLDKTISKTLEKKETNGKKESFLKRAIRGTLRGTYKTIKVGTGVYSELYTFLYKPLYDTMKGITFGGDIPYQHLIEDPFGKEIGPNPYVRISPRREQATIKRRTESGEIEEPLIEIVRGYRPQREIQPLIVITSLILGLFLLSPNITGNVISSADGLTTNSVGIILIFLGLLGGFSFLRGKSTA